MGTSPICFAFSSRGLVDEDAICFHLEGESQGLRFSRIQRSRQGLNPGQVGGALHLHELVVSQLQPANARRGPPQLTFHRGVQQNPVVESSQDFANVEVSQAPYGRGVADDQEQTQIPSRLMAARSSCKSSTVGR